MYEKEVQAESIVHLKELLSADHRQIFTTIQKFQDVTKAVSERDDIIVMTDEAHRTQYDRMAQNMRKALPKAAFIGFTGTPLMAQGEEKTRETFGDYVSQYNFGDSGVMVQRCLYITKIAFLGSKTSTNDWSRILGR